MGAQVVNNGAHGNKQAFVVALNLHQKLILILFALNARVTK